MDTLSVAASGLQSATVRLTASAHNVANLSTDRFHPVSVRQVETPLGGSASRVTQAPQPESVNLAHEQVEQARAGLQYTASARLFVVVAELKGQLADLRA